MSISSKKIFSRITSLILTAFVSVAFAGGPDMPSPPTFNGFYLGAGIGVANTNFDYVNDNHTTYYDPVIGLVATVAGTNSAGRNETSFIGGIHLGYGRVLGNSIYLGVLAGVNFVSQERGDISSHFINDLQNSAASLRADTEAYLNTTEATFDFTPGVLLSPDSLLYAIVGGAFTRTRLQTTTTLSASGTGPNFSIVHELGKYVKRSTDGLRLGLGIKQKVSRKVALFLQYVHTEYARSSVDDSAVFDSVDDEGASAGDDQVVFETRANPTRNAVLFGADWFFSG